MKFTNKKPLSGVSRLIIVYLMILNLTACSTLPHLKITPLSSNNLADKCHKMVAGIKTLQKSAYEIPDHFIKGIEYPQQGDFDPNSYFTIFDHLHIKEGYTLDYVYFYDEMGGYPMLYARPISAVPFTSYTEFSNAYDATKEMQIGPDSVIFSYLDAVEVDGSPESYLQYVILETMGDEFYLWWHSNYQDDQVVCNKTDVEAIREEITDSDFGFNEDFGFSDEQEKQIAKIYFTPIVTINEDEIVVEVFRFTKWGGFSKVIYTFAPGNPVVLKDINTSTVVEYNITIAF